MPAVSRSNAGGYPEPAACRAGRLLGDKAVQLSEVTYRGHRRQWRTPDLPAGTAGPAGRPVAVPASGRTFSSGETLAYHLQARDRATIAGERTPRAADHVTGIRLAATVTGELPSGYCTDSVTGTSWEAAEPRPRRTAPRTTPSTLRWPACRH